MLSHPTKSIERRFLIAIGLTCAILIVELVGGWWTGSLALLADAAHVFTDIFALGLSYTALRFSSLPADEKHTFGYHRFEVFASLINGVTLAVISIWIFWEAYHRFISPQPVMGMELLIIALLGLAGNLVVAFVLRGGLHIDHDDHHHAAVEDVNVQSAMYHVLGDALSSIGVIVAAAIIWRTGWMMADPLAGVLIGMIILAGSWRVIRSSAHIMMQGTPACLNLRYVEELMLSSPGVTEVHDVHIWNLCSHHPILSAHVVMDGNSLISSQDIMKNLKSQLKDRFGIEHSTLQMEYECCENDTVCRTSKSLSR